MIGYGIIFFWNLMLELIDKKFGNMNEFSVDNICILFFSNLEIENIIILNIYISIL